MCFEKENNTLNVNNLDQLFMTAKEREQYVENEPSLEEALNQQSDFHHKMGGISLKHKLINDSMIDYLKS